MASKTEAPNVFQPKLHHCRVKGCFMYVFRLYFHLNLSVSYLPFFVTALTVLTHVQLLSHWDSQVQHSCCLIIYSPSFISAVGYFCLEHYSTYSIDLHVFSDGFPNLYYAFAVSPSLLAPANLISTVSIPSSKTLLRTVSSTCAGQTTAESSKASPSVFMSSHWWLQSQYSFQGALHPSYSSFIQRTLPSVYVTYETTAKALLDTRLLLLLQRASYLWQNGIRLTWQNLFSINIWCLWIFGVSNVLLHNVLENTLVFFQEF